jgi:hypothetical protein
VTQRGSITDLFTPVELALFAVRANTGATLIAMLVTPLGLMKFYTGAPPTADGEL